MVVPLRYRNDLDRDFLRTSGEHPRCGRWYESKATTVCRSVKRAARPLDALILSNEGNAIFLFDLS